MPTPIRPIKERVLERCIKTDSCWLWTGSLGTHGYGKMRYKGRELNAHRVSYFAFKGEVGPDLHIDHLCRNRACVNPDHLEAVSKTENDRRGFGASGINGRKTHCNKGHEFTKENTWLPPSGGRKCKICDGIKKDKKRGVLNEKRKSRN